MLIPFHIKVAVAALLAVALVGFGWSMGAGHVQAQRGNDIAEQATRAVKILVKQGQVTERIVTKTIERVRVIRAKTQTVIQEVPVYVPADIDLPGSFRVFHDAVAAGSVPDPAGIPHAATVTARAVAETVATNYGICHETAEQLKGLQEWVTEMRNEP